LIRIAIPPIFPESTNLRLMERGRTNHLRLVGAGHRALFEQAE
jgi:hypothetical protein